MRFGNNKQLGVTVKSFSLSRISYGFFGRTFDVNVPLLMTLSLIVGIIGGVYGIGGGSIIAPFLVSFCGLPVYTIAGAALMGTFVTSIAGVFFYQAIAPFYPGIAFSRIGPWACFLELVDLSACTAVREHKNLSPQKRSKG